MRLKDKVAIITGASGGIGHAVVRKFVAEGAKVLAVDLKPEAVQKVADEFDGSVVAFAADVTDYAQVEGMVNAAVETFGTLDVMHNNAGIAFAKPFLEQTPEKDWNPHIAVNLTGVYYGILAAARKFIELKKPGVILNTSSIYAQMAAELTLCYNVSKAGVDMLTKNAALELAPHGIRVVGAAPGRVDTPMLRAGEALGIFEHMAKEQMRNKLTQPEEIAAVFAFLACDESNCVNGSTVAAEDGYLNFKFPFPAGAGGGH